MSFGTFVGGRAEKGRQMGFFSLPMIPHSLTVNGGKFHTVTAEGLNANSTVFFSLDRLTSGSSVEEEDLRSLTDIVIGKTRRRVESESDWRML